MNLYRSQFLVLRKKSRLQSLRDAGLFVGFSVLAIMLLLFIMGFVTYALQAEAATGINKQLNYQGKINDSSGLAVADGTYYAKFVIYDAATSGNCLWTAIGACDTSDYGTTTVTTVNGVFSVALGGTSHNSLATSTIDWNTDSLYLGVTIRGTAALPVYDSEMTPRKQITASAYAFNADTIDGLHATSTAAVANYLLSLDSLGNLNLYDKGVSSTRATTSEFILIGNDGGITNLDRSGGDLFVTDDVEIDGGLWVGSATTTGTLYVSEFASSTALYVGITGQTSTSTQIRGGMLVDSTTLVVNANENRVGIGTASPTSTLSVVGTLNVLNSNNSSLLFVNQSNGNVGFGTTQPAASIHTYGTGGDSIILDHDGSYQVSMNFITLGNGTQGLNTVGTQGWHMVARGDQYVIDAGQQNDLMFTYFDDTTADFAMILEHGGNVGINDASPLSLFTVGDGDKFRVDNSGNATTSGFLVIGTTLPPINPLPAGSLYVGGNATTTGNLEVSGYASTTNLVLANGASNLGTYYDLYVNSGNLYFDGTQITGSSGLSAWQYAWDKAITPTSTDIGIYVTASSTIAANFRVDGNATTTGSLWIGSSGTAESLDLTGGDLYIADDVEIDSDLIIDSGGGTNGIYFGVSQSALIVADIVPITYTYGGLWIDASVGASPINNLRVKLGDAAGSSVFAVHDSSEVIQFQVDSDGNATTTGYLSVGSPTNHGWGAGDLGVDDDLFVDDAATIGGSLTVDTTTLVVNASQNNIGVRNASPNSTYLIDIASDSTDDWNKVIYINHDNDASEDSIVVDIDTDTGEATIEGGETRTLKNINSVITPNTQLTNEGAVASLTVYGIDSNVNLGSFTIGSTFAPLTATFYGSNVTVDGNPTFNDQELSSTQNLNIYGSKALISMTPELTSISGGTQNIYAGHFDNSFVWGGNAGHTVNAYGIYAVADNDLTTTGVNTHYGGYFNAAGTADINYGIYTTASGATTNYAGYFVGDLYTNGNATTTGKQTVSYAITTNTVENALTVTTTNTFSTASIDAQQRGLDLNVTVISNAASYHNIDANVYGFDVGVRAEGDTGGLNAGIVYGGYVDVLTNAVGQNTYGLYVESEGDDTSGVADAYGGYFVADSASDNAFALFAHARNSAGTAYGLYTQTDNSAGTNGIGVFIDENDTTGYGLYVDSESTAVGGGLYVLDGSTFLNEEVFINASTTIGIVDSTGSDIDMRALSISLSMTGADASGSNYGEYLDVSHSGAQAASTNLYGLYNTTVHSGQGGTGDTPVVYGLYTFADQTGGTSAGMTRTTIGVWAAADANTSATDNNYGGVFLADPNGTGIGIVAATTTSYTLPTGTDYAGWFKGNVMVTGQLYASGSLQAAGSNDYAEYMKSSEALEPGDVVIFDQTTKNTVKKSIQAYDSKAIGIVSTNPGVLAGGIQDENENQLDRTEMAQRGYYPIALVGQVPVKVSSENGEIMIGDLLTTANTSGYAMKATEKSVGIIGQALEDFSGDKGIINVLIKTSANLETELVVGSFETPSSTPLTVIDNPDLDIQTLIVQQAATFYGTIYVRGEASFEHKVVFKNDVEIEGKLYVSKDQAGTAIILTGATSTEIVFSGEYQNVPKITASSQQKLNGKEYWISNKSTRGFRINLDPISDIDFTFDWIALANKTGNAPVIESFAASRETVAPGVSVELWAQVTDSDTPSSDLKYTWNFEPNLISEISGEDGLIYWTVTEELPLDREVTVTVTVSDGTNEVSESKVIIVVGNSTPPTEEPPVEEEVPPTDQTPTSTEPFEPPQDEPVIVLGCMDQTALNYQPEANYDDGSCEYNQEPVVEEPTSTSTEEIVQGEDSDTTQGGGEVEASATP